jgi:hypothetical protein
MLNGTFGQGDLRHIANWQSRKYTKTWHEEEDGKQVHHTREYFSHECTLLWANGTTQVLTHEAQDEYESPDGNAPDPEFAPATGNDSQAKTNSHQSKVIVMPVRGGVPGKNGNS